ncbi:MAG: transglutaminase domain-containing protein [Anaerolineaceae bacterium]|nr:transglutaminase domain-containing protein [Anaerolineaceae bacterium]
MAIRPALKLRWHKTTIRWLGKIPWLNLLIILALLFILAFSLSEAYWVRNSPPLFFFALIAVFSGWVLGLTRWRIGWCSVYSLLMAVALGVQYVGRIVPMGNEIPLHGWIETMNWQIFVFIERMNGWNQSIQLGKAIYDDGYWTLMLIVLVWLVSAWLAVCLKRHKNTWMALLPLIGAIAFTLQNQQKDVVFLLVALFFGLILVADQFYSRLHTSWKQRQVDFPEQLWVDWTAAVVVISVLVLIIASLAPAVTTREGWHHIRRWMDELKNPKISTVMDNGSGEYNYRPSNGDDEELLLLQPWDLSFVGAPLPKKNGTVMWVRVGDSTPRPWRMAVYNTYTGKGWTEAELDPQSVQVGIDSMQQGRRALVQRFTLFRAAEGRLFAAAEPVQSLRDGVQIVRLDNEDSHVVIGYVQQYELISMVPQVSADVLRNAAGGIPDEILEEYLQYPETLPQRVRNLADRLVEDEPTNYEKVIRIQNYIRQVVPYDLESPPAAEGQDVVDYFLFEAPSGFCSYYASAMAILLRVESIPARVVTGYAPGVYVIEQGNFEVTGDLAHAWVEVYFSGYGWIPFEPTPSQEVPYYASSVPLEKKESETPATSIQQASRRLMLLRIIIGFLIGMVFVWICWLLWRIFRNRQREKKMALHPVAMEYRRLRLKLAGVGISAPPMKTPQEFLQEASGLLTNYPHIQKTLRLCTDLYERTVYSPVLPGLSEMNTLRMSIHQAVKEGWLLRWRYLWERFLIKFRMKRKWLILTKS